MKILELLESLSDWGTEWVHYSDHPMLTVNTKQFHSDPAGLYFFPASHVAQSEMWHNKKHAYIVTIRPGARILDISQITQQDIDRMVDGAGIRETYNAYITQYPPKDLIKAFDMAWEYLQRHFAYEGGKTRQFGAFNALLQRLGWDAIFDDTGSIHSVEPQLLVLNRKIIESVRRNDKKGSGFADMQKVLGDLQQLGSQFAPSKVSAITKPTNKSYYSDRDNLLMARVDIGNSEDYMHSRYATLKVSIQKSKPDVIYIYLSSSNPRLNYGSGDEYFIPKQAYREPLTPGSRGLASDLQKIFSEQGQQAPTA